VNLRSEIDRFGRIVRFGGRRGEEEKRFRRGPVFEVHRLMYHSTLGSRVIKRRREEYLRDGAAGANAAAPLTEANAATRRRRDAAIAHLPARSFVRFVGTGHLICDQD